MPAPKFAARPMRMLCIALLFVLPACLPRPQVALQIPPAHCLDQVPKSLLADTPGAAPPILPAGQIDWQAVGRGWAEHAVAQAGQLALANARPATIVAIIANCEAREAEIRTALQPKRKRFGLF